MLQPFIRKLFGTKNERELKRITPLVEKIRQLEPALQALDNAALAAKSGEFKQRLSNGEPLDQLLPEAFAVVREVSRRTLGLRHFDSQMVGGIALHEGKIAEMKTGEGKTLVGTLPVYLNALVGQGVHIVTVNDYLARRDAAWMGPVYNFLGMSVGVITHGMTDQEHAAAYRADCTYGTNNEFGFDYLRDNMKFSLESYVQRGLHFAIVDEVDSILVDEARTPLIISGLAEESTQLYYQVNQIMPLLTKETHFTLDEKARTVLLTDDGVKLCEQRLNVDNLYDALNISVLHHVNQGLRAHALFHLDVDYVVKDDQVIIVDEFTGRLMPGRRWSDGLHQAVEAKEGVRIENENQTLATITFQNYFRMYKKLAGMTGTADTEAGEFAKIYNLEVLVIPTNRPMIRVDRDDMIYKNEAAKFNAVVEEIKTCHARHQPVLVGTISIDNSERLSALLKRSGVTHNVLNAKHHEKEAEIVAQAGRKDAVTISTNMAGRGTDIKLGGDPERLARARVGHDATDEAYQAELARYVALCAQEREAVVAAGGLYILGTERHESRRIDNQLRGRSGRQGDPGLSCFYLSLDDDLLRIFGGDRIKGMMERLGMKDDEVIQHKWLNRAIENAQKKVEERNFSIRKNLLEYDDVMNQQRQQVYKRRREILGQSDLSDLVLDMADTLVGQIVDDLVPERIERDGFDTKSLGEKILQQFNMQWRAALDVGAESSRETIGRALYDAVESAYRAKIAQYGEHVFRQVEKYLLLTTLDSLWKEHLLQMDHMKEGINLRGYAQKDPLVEYKREGFTLFQIAMHMVAQDTVEKVMRVEIRAESAAAVDLSRQQPAPRAVEIAPQSASAFAHTSAHDTGHVDEMRMASGDHASSLRRSIPTPSPRPIMHSGPKTGRNDACPCGSGKKFKKCHGANE